MAGDAAYGAGLSADGLVPWPGWVNTASGTGCNTRPRRSITLWHQQSLCVTIPFRQVINFFPVSAFWMLTAVKRGPITAVSIQNAEMVSPGDDRGRPGRPAARAAVR